MNLFNKILNGELFRNVATLFMGTLLAQLIPVMVAPILTRLYTPEAFGIFSLFLSVSFIFASFSTGKYELAIMLPKSHNKSYLLYFLALGLSLILNSIFFIIVFFYNVEMAKILGDEQASVFLLLSPLLSFVTSMYITTQYLSNRQKKYKQIAVSKIAQTGSATLFHVSAAYFLSTLGLVVGQRLGQIIGLLILLKQNIVLLQLSLKKTHFRRFYLLAKEYKKFPLAFSFSYGLNTVVANITPIILGASFGIKYAGFYLLVQRALGVPANMITSSIGNVIFQKITTLQDCRKLYISISVGLFVLGSPFALLLYFYAPDVFVWFFGPEWIIAGEMASVLTVNYLLSVVTNSVAQFSIVHQKVLYNVLWQLTLLFGVLIAWYLSIISNNIFVFLKIFICVQCSLYIIGYVYEYSLCQHQAKYGR